MQTVLSEMFDNMLNTQIEPLNFIENTGYFGKCDYCLKLKALIKINNEKLLCKSCHDISDKLDNKPYSINSELKEELINKVIEKNLKIINDKQQCIEAIEELSNRLRYLIRLNTKMIEKLHSQLNKL